MTSERSKTAKIGELCTFSNGHGFTPRDWKTSGFPIIRIQNLNGSQNFNYYQGVPKQEWVVNPGDLLFAWAGVKGVSFGPTIWKGPEGVLNQHIYQIHPVSGVNKIWLYYALGQVTFDIERKAHGFKTSLVHVHKSDITNAIVANTSPDEQAAIADLLSTWDEAIEKTEQLIAAKGNSFTSLTRELIHNCAEGLRHFHLRDICEPVTRKNTVNELNVLTTSAQHGLISQMDYYKKSVSAEDVRGYYLLKKGEFAYNRSSSNGYPYGAIKRLEDYPQGVLSILYLCFSLKKDAPCDSDFMAHAFEAGFLNKQLVGVCQEGARSHGLLNITKTDFFGLKLSLPEITEQRKIAAILSTARQEIDLLKKQVDALRRQKRGLMQKLLTGVWRLKADVEVNS